MACGTCWKGEGESWEVWLGPPHLLKHELLDELSVVLTAVARVVGRDPLSTQDRRSVCVCDVCMCVCVCVCVCV